MTISEKPSPSISLEVEFAQKASELRSRLGIFVVSARYEILNYQLSASRLRVLNRRRMSRAEQSLLNLGQVIDEISDEQLPKLAKDLFSDGERRENRIKSARAVIDELVQSAQVPEIASVAGETGLLPVSDQSDPSLPLNVQQ